MVGVGLQEFGLTKYLITEVLKNEESKLEALRDFMPTAQLEDWELVTAGQRVQVIKPTGDKRFGSLEFGTAVLSDADGSLAGLLGASPGASISVRAMIDVIERCFGKQMGDWSGKLKEMIPSYGVRLSDDKALFDEVWDHSQKSLQLG